MEVSPGFSPSPRSPKEQNTSFQSIQSSDNENDEASRRQRITPTNRPQNLKDDQFLADAGLNRTGVIRRKSSREKLLGKRSSPNLILKEFNPLVPGVHCKVTHT